MKEADRQRAILRRLAGMGDSVTPPAAIIPTGFAALDESPAGASVSTGAGCSGSAELPGAAVSIQLTAVPSR